MIRGAIDYITPQAIGGWIFSEIASVKDRLVLAFWKNECIGSGTVALYREDLAKAGLGDGHLGFNFPIGVPEGIDPAEVFVKLSDSDFILKQSATIIVGQSNVGSVNRYLPIGCFRSAAWMRERGWIRQDECDFISRVDTVGVYSRILARNELAFTNGSSESSPLSIIKDLFETFNQANLDVVSTIYDSVTEALAAISNFVQSDNSGYRCISALWTNGSTTISVQEGSHVSAQAANESFVGIDYPISSSRLLFVDCNLRMRPKEPTPSSGIVVYTAKIIY